MKIKVTCTNSSETKFVDLDCCDAIVLNRELLTIYGHVYSGGDDIKEIPLCTVPDLDIADKVLEKVVSGWRSGNKGVMNIGEYVSDLVRESSPEKERPLRLRF